MEQVLNLYLREARHNLEERNYGKAYAFFLLTLKISPEIKNEIAEDFGTAWKHWSQELFQLNRTNDLLDLYEQGNELFMHSDALHLHMGKCLFLLNLKVEAVGMFRKALILNPNSQDAFTSLENASRGLVDSWHFGMLNDKKRNITFSNAIKDAMDTIDWDNCILDIGSGTGLLGMYAIRHGAAKVHCCEMSELMNSIAEECIGMNDMESSIIAINSDSLKLDVSGGKDSIPQRATLVLSEILDAGLLGEGVVDSLCHAWKDLMVPREDGGIVIPYCATVYCALAECEHIWKKHTVEQSTLEHLLLTSGVGHDVGKSNASMQSETNLPNLLTTCVTEPYTSERLSKVSHKVLSSPVKLMDINFNDFMMLDKIAQGSFGEICADFHNLTEGNVDCLVLWFKVFLDPERKHCIETHIGSDFCWDQAIYPIRSFNQNGLSVTFDRLSMQPNDILRANFTVHIDRFQLESIDKLSFDAQCTRSFPQNLSVIPSSFPNLLYVALHETQITKVNDIQTSNLYIEAITNVASSMAKLRVLDISAGFSLMPFLVCNQLGPKAQVHKICQTEEMLKAYTAILIKHNVQNVTFGLTGQPLTEDSHWDIVMSEVVDPSGLLMSNALTNLIQVRSFLKQKTVFIPQHISLQVQCIQSKELLSLCMVTSDANTLDIKVAGSINPYRVSVHSDLNVKALDYSVVSETKEGFSMNFQESHATDFTYEGIKHSIVSKVLSSGTIHAVLFWFKISLSKDLVVETIDESNYWHTAAYVFPLEKQLESNCGEELVITTSLKNDLFLFSLHDSASNG